MAKKILFLLFIFVCKSGLLFSGHSEFVVEILGWKYENKLLSVNDLWQLLNNYNIHEIKRESLEKKLKEFEFSAPLTGQIDEFVSTLISAVDGWIVARSNSESCPKKGMKLVRDELLHGDSLKPGTLARIYDLNFDDVDIRKYGVTRFCNKLELCKNVKTLSLKNMKLNKLTEEEWTALGFTLQWLKRLKKVALSKNNLNKVKGADFKEFIEFCFEFEEKLELDCGFPGSNEYEFVEKILLDYPQELMPSSRMTPKLCCIGSGFGNLKSIDSLGPGGLRALLGSCDK
jgi:hypothetical protein